MGNRERFREALQRASEFMWSEQWKEAVRYYRRALKEFPDDSAALRDYAWALYQAGELEEAHEVYRRLIDLSPDEPLYYERLATLTERDGRYDEAARLYAEAASLYRKQDAEQKAVEMLEAAAQLKPDNIPVLETLYDDYTKRGEIEKAIVAAVWLAHLYQEKSPEKSVDICRRTQRLAPTDRRLAQVMYLLQTGRPIPRPSVGGDFAALDDAVAEVRKNERKAKAQESNPMLVARQQAMSTLAELAFEGLPTEAAILVGQALDAQSRGDLEVAASAYEGLLAQGIAKPAIHFSLGLIYKEQMRFAEAIEQFEKALADETLQLASHVALGECYQAEGNFEEALRHFLEAVKTIDLTTVRRDQVPELLRVYEGLAQNLVNTGRPARTEQIIQSLVLFLNRRGWEEEVIKARRRLGSLMRNGPILSLAEIISLPDAQEVMRSVAMAQEYMRRRRFYSALEELSWTIGKAPFYLPLHSMLGYLLLESDNLEGALAKFQMIARTYEVRGQMGLAIATYRQVLELSPLDVEVRRRMIDLLVQRGEIDEALTLYLEMADAYYQMAQTDKARQVYVEALRLAPRGSDDKPWKIRLYHRLGDLDMMRLDWSAAVKDYEEIIRIDPTDEKAAVALYRLYPKLGRPQLGLSVLDRLIKHYLSRRQVRKAIKVLKTLLEEDETSIALHYRLAQLYLHLGMRDEVVQELDILGGLQLDAGLTEEAVKTVEQLLSLNPPNYDDYAQFYRELTGKEPPPPPTAEEAAGDEAQAEETASD